MNSLHCGTAPSLKPRSPCAEAINSDALARNRMNTSFHLGRSNRGQKGPFNFVLDHELSELRLLLERHSGVLLNSPREVLVSKVADYLEARRFQSVADLVGRLQSSDTECERLLE